MAPTRHTDHQSYPQACQDDVVVHHTHTKMGTIMMETVKQRTQISTVFRANFHLVLKCIWPGRRHTHSARERENEQQNIEQNEQHVGSRETIYGFSFCSFGGQEMHSFVPDVHRSRCILPFAISMFSISSWHIRNQLREITKSNTWLHRCLPFDEHFLIFGTLNEFPASVILIIWTKERFEEAMPAIDSIASQRILSVSLAQVSNRNS